MPKLIIEKGPNKGSEITVVKTIFAGRDTTAHVVLTEPMVSRLHFQIEQRHNAYYLIDLDSLNGTFVNRARVKEKHLKIGDMIQIGDTILSFVSDDPQAEQRNLIGKIIGGYSIIERIGRGGMGTVYKALQISLNRIVALKILSDEMLKDKMFIEMFLQEARSSAQLNHNNIVQVYDVGRTADDTYYFSMEFMPGGSIQESLMKRQRFPVPQAIKMISDAARGLEFAEKKGIVHRDIKPDNLMFGEDEIVKIGDLGLAKSIYSPSPEQVNAIIGTPHYLAPEQAQPGRTVDHRADIYSLGASLYRILAGSTPYTASSVKEIILKKLKEDPPSLKKSVPSLPDSVVELVEKMMKRDVNERYQNATGVVKDLQKIKEEIDPSRQPVRAAEISGMKDLTEAEKILRKSFFARFILPVLLLATTLVAVFLVIHYYKINTGKTQKPSPVFVLPPADKTSSEYEEELAKQYFNEAQNYESHRLNVNSKSSITEGVQLYERILSKCPNSRLIKQTQSKIASLKKLYTTAEEKEQQLLLEQKTLALYNTLEKEIAGKFQETLSASSVEPADNFIKESFGKLDEFNRKYSQFSSVTERIKKKRSEISKWFDKFQEVGEKYQTLKKQVENFVNNDQFDIALKLILQFSENPAYQNTIPAYQNNIHENIARNYYKEIEKLAEDSFLEMMQEVDNLIDKNSLADARTLLSKNSGAYGIDWMERQIKDKLDWFNSQKDRIYGKLLQTESEKITQTYISFLWLLQSGQFDELDTRQQAINSQFQTKECSEELSKRLSTIEQEKNILKKFLNKLIERKTDYKLLGKEVVSVYKGLISFKDNTASKWQDITALDWALCISSAGDLTARDYLELGILCARRGGAYKKADEYFDKALKMTADLRTKLSINKEKSKVEESKNNREKEAFNIKQEAEKLFNEQRYPLAIEGFRLIKYRYWNTNVYLEAKTSIDKRISECEKK